MRRYNINKKLIKFQLKNAQFIALNSDILIAVAANHVGTSSHRSYGDCRLYGVEHRS